MIALVCQEKCSASCAHCSLHTIRALRAHLLMTGHRATFGYPISKVSALESTHFIL